MISGRVIVPVLLGLLACAGADAREFKLSFGSGPQPGGDQSNRLVSADFLIHTFERSARQHISIGVAYTRLETDTNFNRRLEAVTVYPEFTFYPAAEGRIRAAWPERIEPYFFTRFLGPSYISSNSLGDRHQDKHFSFLAEVGVGMRVERGDRHSAVFRVSWKHLSNARLFDPNDGIDVPFVLSMGFEF